MKFLAKLLTALAVVGAVLLVAGLCLGGRLYTGYANGRLWPLDFGFHFDSHASHNGALPGIDPISVPELPDVTELRIEVSAGSCTIRKDGIDFQYSGSVHAEQEDDILTLKVTAGDADITLPDRYFGSVSVEVSGGDVEIESLRGDSCAVSLRAGELSVEEIESRTCAISVAMGSAEIDNIDSPTCSLSLAAGELTVDDLDAFDISASCTGGDMELGLRNGAPDYSCEAHALAGEVTWNGKPLSSAGFSGEEAERALTLNVTGGSLNLFPG